MLCKSQQDKPQDIPVMDNIWDGNTGKLLLHWKAPQVASFNQIRRSSKQVYHITKYEFRHAKQEYSLMSSRAMSRGTALP